MLTFSDKIRGEYYKINFIDPTYEQITEQEQEQINEFKKTLRYNEESVCVIGDRNADRIIKGVKTDYATARHLAKTRDNVRLLSSVVTLQCADGFVGIRRSSEVSKSGEIHPVCELAEAEDVQGNVLSFKKVAERGLKEELGVEGSRIFFGHGVITPMSFVGVCYSYTKSNFKEIVHLWGKATHRDEGEPVLLNIFENQESLAKVFKKQK